MPWWLALPLLLQAPVASATQVQPDFSGRWTLESLVSAPPDAARVLVVEQPLTTKNIRGEPMSPAYLRITIRRERDTGTSVETRLIGISGGSLGGTVFASGATIPAPRTYTSTRWENGALVFRDGSYTGDAERTGTWTERGETWSLEPDGRLRVEISIEASSQPPRVDVFVYRRQ